jgi:L-2-hydroxyglutarate oxidase LhgO
MTEEIDCVVVGAGVIGLAIGRAMARSGRETVILESENIIGTGISSRNSEVIHAGIYYPQGSLKARLCVSGRDRLYDYCSSRHIGHRKCGKLIVATSMPQIEILQQIESVGRANGVDDLIWLDREQVRHLEPEIRCVGALLSPSTGIVDSHAYLLSLLGEAEAAGAVIAYATSVNEMAIGDDRIAIFVNGDSEPSLRAKIVVNAAGLGAINLAKAIADFPVEQIPSAWTAKGNYFTFHGRQPFNRLIYPVPEPGGLGIHATIDLVGQVRFGPDVEWCDGLDYTVDANRSSRFYEAIRSYWPALPDHALYPGYAGIRPKLCGPGQAAADFYIGGPSSHGVPGIINLFGIESPGLTASLAIADEVLQIANQSALAA